MNIELSNFLKPSLKNWIARMKSRNIRTLWITVALAFAIAIGLHTMWPQGGISGLVGTAVGIWLVASIPTALIGLFRGFSRFQFSLIPWLIIAALLVFASVRTNTYDHCIASLPPGASPDICI